MEEILWVVTATGTKESGNELAHTLQDHGKVMNAATLLGDHRLRETYAPADDNPMANSSDEMVDSMAYTRQLHQKYNWGLHPSSLQEGGFAYRFKFAATTSDDTVGMIRAFSSDYPDLYFDVAFCRLDDDSAGFLLFQGGDIVMFSSIEGEAFDAFHKVYEEIGERICNESADPDDEEWKHDPESAREMHFMHGFF